jgi:hypothetical protein
MDRCPKACRIRDRLAFPATGCAASECFKTRLMALLDREASACGNRLKVAKELLAPFWCVYR